MNGQNTHSYPLLRAIAGAGVFIAMFAMVLHASEGGEPQSILHVDPKILGFQIVNFLILFAILKAFLMEPVEKMLAQRQNQIQEDLSRAKNEGEAAARLRQDYETKIGQVKEECHELMQKAIRESEHAKAHILGETEKEIHQKRVKAEHDLLLQREKAKKELKTDAVDLSISLTAKLLGREVNAKDQQKLIDEFLNQLG